MRRRILIGIAGLMAIGVVLLLALTQPGSSRSGHPTPTPTPSCLPNCPESAVGVPVFATSASQHVPDKVTDLSPGLTLYYKGASFVQHPDGTLEAFYMAPEMAEGFVQGLPAGDKIDLVFPPESALGPGHEPPTDPPPP